MTPANRALARHALGLPNENMRSYRNRYVATRRTKTENEWRDMVNQEYAKIQLYGATYAGFCLTLAGAQLALDPGETLDMEDFSE